MRLRFGGATGRCTIRTRFALSKIISSQRAGTLDVKEAGVLAAHLSVLARESTLGANRILHALCASAPALRGADKRSGLHYSRKDLSEE